MCRRLHYPPACKETEKNFPVTALLGPAGVLPEKTHAGLPFDVPRGMGVIVANNPPVDKKQNRPIFDIDTQDPELQLGLQWFLLLGLTQECLINNPFSCDFSNTIAQPISTPGIYAIIMWDPRGKKQDYTANIGLDERNFTPNPDIEDLARNNGLLHRKCKVPKSKKK